MRKTKGEGGAAAAGASEAAITAGPAPGEGAGATAAAAVAAYLQGHPDYFASNPQILAELHIPHTAAGAAVSLIERQVRVLRAQLETERGRLAQLIARAREYEAFSARLHALVLALIAAPDLTRVTAALQEGLMHEFSAQAVTLKVFPVDPAADAADSDPLVAAFRDFLERKHALCGPLDQAKNAALFGDLHDPAGEQVHCAALIPIRANGRCGVLAIGAADPDRFKPDMRTDLLDRLGEIVSCKLQMLPPEVPTAVAPPPPAPASEDAPKPTPTRRKRAKKTVPE